MNRSSGQFFLVQTEIEVQTAHKMNRTALATCIENWNRSPARAWYCLDQPGPLRSDLVRVWFDSV